ncbi:MAG: DUF4013 domain-containing protein [Candidatus Omnitrophica bacterium]|nr:DUF4013 domain-containing protein [Candidatus Omnitrophota bacterium]
MKKKILDAFKEPVRTQDNLINLLIGGVLTLIPVVNFISMGYLGAKLKKNIEQNKSSVKWDENIEKLFVKGAFLTFICLSYVIIPVLLLFLSGRFMVTLSGGRFLSLFYFRGQVMNIIGTLLLLIALYLLPFAVCLYLEDNDLKKAFKPRKILEKIFLIIKEYTVVYATIIALLAVSIIVLFLLMNWLAGLLTGGFIFFYDGMVISGILSKFFPRKAITISLLEVSEE